MEPNALNEQNNALTRENRRIYRYFCNGGSWARPGKLACLITGDLVEGLRRYALHHIRFENGVSVNKTDLHPFAILKEVELSRPENTRYLLDLMGTVPIGWEEHSELHKREVSGDIGDIPPNKLPWALKNKENFEGFRSLIGLKVTYEDFVNLQRNIPHSLLPTRSRRSYWSWAAVSVCVGVLVVAILSWTGEIHARLLGERGPANNCPPDRPIKGVSAKGERCFSSEREAKRAGWQPTPW